jgi:hypothetical protein
MNWLALVVNVAGRGVEEIERRMGSEVVCSESEGGGSIYRGEEVPVGVRQVIHGAAAMVLEWAR